MNAGRHRATHRIAFTLVELLVVIAIIGILVALLLPAIQAAREAARRANCQSNMKNIALGLVNYHSTNQRFPVGFVPTGPQGSIESWSWSIFALPYLEEQQLYDRLWPSARFVQPVDGNRRPGGTANSGRNLADLLAGKRPDELALLQTHLPVFRCPSDSTPPLIPVPTPPDPLTSRTFDNGRWERHFNGQNAPAGFQPSTSNYVGSMGYIDATCPCGGNPCVIDQNRCDNNGIFYGNSQVAIKHITDGTSKTFLIGERDKFCLSATWIGARNPLDGADMWSSRWVLAHVFFPLNHPVTGHHDTCTESFSSAHAGGAFFAFCDGSVRFIDDDIEFNNLAARGQSKTCFADRSASPLYCRTQIGGESIGVYQRLAWRDDDLPITNNN